MGTGAAGLAAALSASEHGSDVVVLESGSTPGGTTARSSGVWWAPNNSLVRALGRADPKADALRYMARVSHPERYDPDHPSLGLEPAVHQAIDAYYEWATLATDRLAASGALRPTLSIAPENGARGFDSLTWPDYYSTLPEDKLPMGRALVTRPRTPTQGYSGVELIEQMVAVLQARNVPILTNSPACDVLLNDDREVVGVQLAGKRTATPWIRARQGVIFASGGFTHNLELRTRHITVPIYGGCAVPTNQGDLLRIATELGARTSNLDKAWWVQNAFEVALVDPSAAHDVFYLPGDSMILVDRNGRRVVNEKTQYQERTQAHFVWDEARHEYPNRVLFYVYDQRTARIFVPIAGAGVDKGDGTPRLPGVNASHVVQGDTVEELTERIGERLRRLASETGGLTLASDFAATLRATIERFNAYARAGHDPEFARGDAPIDHWANGPAQPDNSKNATMFPLSERGPYFCVLLCGATLDTCGGPLTNEKGQLMREEDAVIPGLFGAGNCVSTAGPGYWGPGATIGRGIAFGYRAGYVASHSARRTVGG